MIYQFDFTVAPTDNSWWSFYRNESIDVHANNLSEAIDAFVEELNDRFNLSISRTAKKNPQKMYRDTDKGAVQVGYVFKASTEVDFDRRWVKKYADIWTEIAELKSVFA